MFYLRVLYAQGVGKKIAQRIILELKDKLGGGSLDFSSGAAPTLPVQTGNQAALAHAALQELGYSPAEISQALKGAYTTGPGSIKRFNMFTSSVIRGEAAKGYSTGQAMAILEEIAQKHLPENIGLEWSGLSYQEKQAGGQTGLVLTLVFVFVFLFLAALYESWLIPVAVLLSLPVAALGAYLGVWLCGLENDVYFQIGLVMLMGLAAKNAILIVEFAKEQVDAGKGLIEATLHAASLRFRPILMTSLAFILGMLPMVMAAGPGSASRRAIGTGVFFGMIVAVVIGNRPRSTKRRERRRAGSPHRPAAAMRYT